jgi:hypothetical protein
MSFKTQWQRDKLRKKVDRGFRGYPVATIAYYGPDDQRASKVVVGIVAAEGADADPMEKWYSDTTDLRSDSRVIEEILALLQKHGVKSVAAIGGIIGCPHQEGIDYPEGGSCPVCPFWKNRDRFTGKLAQ